jgi:hypothetical protein
VFVISSPLLWLAPRHVPEPARGSRHLLRHLLGRVVGLIMLLATRSEKMRRAGLTEATSTTTGTPS